MIFFIPIELPPREGKWVKYLMRGDCEGRLSVWKIPETPECASMQLTAEASESEADLISLRPVLVNSLEEIWKAVKPAPVGVLNQLDVVEDEDEDEDEEGHLTATMFLPMQCRLVCGRDDGSIIMVPATQTIMLHLLSGKHQNFNNWPQHQVRLRPRLLRVTRDCRSRSVRF